MKVKCVCVFTDLWHSLLYSYVFIPRKYNWLSNRINNITCLKIINFPTYKERNPIYNSKK